MVHLTKDRGYAQMVRRWMALEMKQIRKEDRWQAYNRKQSFWQRHNGDLEILGWMAVTFLIGILGWVSFNAVEAFFR